VKWLNCCQKIHPHPQPFSLIGRRERVPYPSEGEGGCVAPGESVNAGCIIICHAFFCSSCNLINCFGQDFGGARQMPSSRTNAQTSGRLCLEQIMGSCADTRMSAVQYQLDEGGRETHFGFSQHRLSSWALKFSNSLSLAHSSASAAASRAVRRGFGFRSRSPFSS